MFSINYSLFSINSIELPLLLFVVIYI